MKKEPISIKDGNIKGYDDPLRRYAPIDKKQNPPQYVFKHVEEAHKNLVKEEEKLKRRKELEIYHARFRYRVWMFIGMLIFSVYPFYVSLKSGVENLDLEKLTLCYLSALLSNYMLLKMFFLGVGREKKIQRRLQASRAILYVVFLGLQLIFIITYLLYRSVEERGVLAAEDEILIGILFIVMLILWLVTIIMAVFNKVQVNVHNQD